MQQGVCHSWILIGVAFGSILTVIPATAQKAKAGITKGELKVDSHTFPLRFAYALEVDDIEGISLERKSKKTLVLQITDSELPPEAIGDFFRCAALARGGKLNAVEFQLDPAMGTMLGATVYYGQGPEKSPNLSISVSRSSSTYVFQDLKIGPNTISGKALMPDAEKWPSLDAGKEGFTYQYATEFKSKITHQPPVTTNLTGVTAQNSPAVKTMLAYDAACRKGDMESARRLSTPGTTTDMETFLAKEGTEKYRKMAQSLLPQEKVRLKQIIRVVVRGNIKATVIFKEEGGSGWRVLVKKNGVWLMDHS